MSILVRHPVPRPIAARVAAAPRIIIPRAADPAPSGRIMLSIAGSGGLVGEGGIAGKGGGLAG